MVFRIVSGAVPGSLCGVLYLCVVCDVWEADYGRPAYVSSCQTCVGIVGPAHTPIARMHGLKARQPNARPATQSTQTAHLHMHLACSFGVPLFPKPARGPAPTLLIRVTHIHAAMTDTGHSP